MSETKIPGIRNTGVVIFLDALGTRGSWLRNNPEETLESMKQIRADVKMAHESIGKKEFLNEEIPITFDSFSDTFIFTAHGGSIKNIIKKCSMLVQEAIVFGMHYGVFFRGAMSYGNFYRHRSEESSFLIGPAIDEVAEWYEKANWIGVNAAPTANYLLDKMYAENIMNDVDKFVKYPVPLQDKTYEMWAIDWISDAQFIRSVIDSKAITHRYNKGYSNVKEIMLKNMRETERWIYNQFSNAPSSVKDFSKFDNTVEFFRHVRKIRQE